MDKEADSTGPSPLLAGPALGQGLEPFLREACEDRLGPVTWFRTDWQHGGAATGRARLRLEDGSEAEVVVKLPVSLTELRWLDRLQSAPILSRFRSSLPLESLWTVTTSRGW